MTRVSKVTEHGGGKAGIYKCKCDPCRLKRNEYNRARYNSRPEVKADALARSKKTMQEAFEYAKELKERTPCADCKESFPYYVMQFDHLPGSSKFKNISRMYPHGLKAVKREIDKCEVVCANCHAIRTWSRKEVP